MSTVVNCENFLLRRAASEQLKAAAAMRQLASGYEVLRAQIVAACDKARLAMEEAAALSGLQAAQGAAERARSLAVLADGNLEAMIAERDRLLTALSHGCLRCDGYSPIGDKPCCADRCKH